MSVTHAPNVRVIDDDLDVRKTLSDILRIKGCDVASAENGGGRIANTRSIPASGCSPRRVEFEA